MVEIHDNSPFIGDKSVQMLAAAVQGAGVAVAISRISDSRYVAVNEAFEDLFGFARSELLGRTSAEFGLWHDRSERDLMMARIHAEGSVSNFEARYRKLSGEIGDVSVSSRITSIDGGLHLISFLTEITERKRLERNLLMAQARLRVVLNATGQLVFHQDRDFRYTWVANPALGATQSDLIGRSDDEIMGVERARPLMAVKRRVMETGVAERQEIWVANNGHSGWFDLLVEPEVDADGRVTGIICSACNITAKRQLEERTAALSIAQRAAESVSRAKSLFLSRVSHELRTPMNAIMGMNDLARRLADKPLQASYLDKLEIAANRLLAVINDLLNIAGREPESLSPNPGEFRLGDIFCDVGKNLRPDADKKGLVLNLVCAGPLLERLLWGDADRLTQVILKLVGNAIKFTPKGQVDLRLSADPSPDGGLQLRCEVQDTGIGILQQDQARVFELFEQADGSSTRAFGGAGLGLALCQKLVTGMGGQMGLDSQFGIGSTFWFTLNLQVKNTQ